MKSPSAILILVLSLTGCATSRFTPYVGAQQDWPTAPGAFATSANGITIYRGWPPRPYEVVGRLVAENAMDRQLAWSAKAHQADAVLIVDSQTVNGGSVTLPGTSYTAGNIMAVGNSYSGSSYTTHGPTVTVPVSNDIVTAWLITFKHDSVTKPTP